MRILLFGPAASGKGTYADMLSKDLKVPHISMGELLRQFAEKSDYGKELKERFWGKGLLVPDDITIDILSQSLGKKGFILEGFPRDLNQAQLLDRIVKVDHAVYLKISEDTIIKRISGRLQCPKCGAVYNKFSNPPKKDSVCDNDGTKLYVRPDDKDVKAIKERLKIFHESTMPVIEHYKRKGVLREVDGEPEIEIVYKSILRIIRPRSRK
ncbi:MAG: nucleoside monophosphate kinase [archaeon]